MKRRWYYNSCYSLRLKLTAVEKESPSGRGKAEEEEDEMGGAGAGQQEGKPHTLHALRLVPLPPPSLCS